MPNQPVYRVTKILDRKGTEPKARVLWEGSNLQQLLRRFPVLSAPKEDPLMPYYADPEGAFEVHRYWHTQQPDGSWKRCRDPRPLTPELRALEDQQLATRIA